MVPLRINDRIFGDDRKYDKIKNQPTLAIFQEAEMSDMSRKWSYYKLMIGFSVMAEDMTKTRIARHL